MHFFVAALKVFHIMMAVLSGAAMLQRFLLRPKCAIHFYYSLVDLIKSFQNHTKKYAIKPYEARFKLKHTLASQ